MTFTHSMNLRSLDPSDPSGKKPAGITLNERQSYAQRLVASGKNILLTGPAGTGKSTAVNAIRKQFPGIRACASTGVAALQIQGCTAHSLFCLGRETDLGKIMTKLNPWHVDRLQQLTRVIIDEISMIGSGTLEAIDSVLRYARNTDQPFGGIQIIGVGDFAQLPPVKDDYAFESSIWEKAGFSTVSLNQIYRQSDEAFCGALNRARLGGVTNEDLQLINTRVAPGGNAVPWLMSTNRDVDVRNFRMLENVPGEVSVLEARDEDKYDPVGAMGSKKMNDNCLAPYRLMLKPGARVMHLINRDELVNGDVGVVTQVKSHEVSVRFDRFPEEEFRIGKETWRVLNAEEQELASRIQFPLKLAWATTIHKSQGVTLDAGHYANSSSFNPPGSAYVAVSRIRSLEGLTIQNPVTHSTFTVDPRVQKFYTDAEEALKKGLSE